MLKSENTIAVLSSYGARRALNLISDIAKGKKMAVTFILDPRTNQIIEAHSGKEIEVEYRERKNN